MRNFPAKILLLSTLPLWAIMAVLMAAEAAGHRWNVHGDFIPMAFGALITGTLAVIAEGIAVPLAWRWLRLHPARRTPWRYGLLVFGSVNFLIIVGAVVYAVLF
ncbi:hypothetical protein HNP33_004151 [Comamonas odontotermitis]|uniref:Uncharacterized protein n=1 Tax=Comamonas odontotermitis TaxID=379895 RepID=A0ABR6RLG1_9BURK|nr:hypothetical protein [Comamonas odontotermitis]MBB6580025.1 hypothetical protein [Comamonas odontotermitis]